MTQAVPLGIFAAFEFNSPFIFIQFYNFTELEYSLSQLYLITIHFLSSCLCMIAINHYPLSQVFRIGVYVYLAFVIQMGVLLIGNYPFLPWLVIIFMSFLAFSLPFIGATATARVADRYGDERGIAFSLLALIRNMASSGIGFTVSILSRNTPESIFTLFLPFILLAMWVLKRGMKLIKQKT